MDNEIYAAVRWWQDVLRSKAKHDNGDRSNNGAMTFMLATLASSEIKPLTEEQIETFGSFFSTRLRMHLEENAWRKAVESGEPTYGSYCRVIHCDYGPDPRLADSAKDAGIDSNSLRWPWKTVMWINPGSVKVACGYGAEPIQIYPENEKQ